MRLASQVPQPTCWWKWVTPCQAGTLSCLGGSSWLIPLRRSTRPPPQVLWARGPCPRNTDSYTKQEKQGERKELTTKNKTEPTLSQLRHLSIWPQAHLPLSCRCDVQQNSCWTVSIKILVPLQEVICFKLKNQHQELDFLFVFKCLYVSLIFSNFIGALPA